MTKAGGMVLFSGGSGGAKLAHGMAQILPSKDLTVIVNTADDFEHLGLAISPDIDSVLYTLAGRIDAARGWGCDAETWQVMEALADLGGPQWFKLGDRDIALHLLRTERHRRGETKDETTCAMARALGVETHVLPMSNMPVYTLLDTDRGRLGFQDYFVACKAEPRVHAVHFDGLGHAMPIAALRELLTADVLVVGPSNPFVSIGPIRVVTSDWRPAAPAPVVAVSPLIGGSAIKGPTAAMMISMLGEATNLALARHYRGYIDALVIDAADAGDASAINALGIEVLATSTWLRTLDERKRLASEIVAFTAELRRRW